jgi:hypothetical protein
MPPLISAGALLLALEFAEIGGFLSSTNPLGRYRKNQKLF